MFDRRVHWNRGGLLLLLCALFGAAVGWSQPADEAESEKPTASPQKSEAKAAMTEAQSEEANKPAESADAEKAETDEGVHIVVHRDRTPEIVKFGADAVVREGEESSEVVVIFGSATIDGRVRGNTVVIGGKAKVNGTVDGNLVVQMGSAELGPKAHVRDNAVVIGGELVADPAARVDGNRVEMSWPVIEEKVPAIAGAKHWIMNGLILGRPLPHQPGWWWWWALGCAIIYLITGLIFSRPIGASVETLAARPVGSFFMGVLIFILFIPLQLLLLATGVGIVIVPFLICAAIVAFLFGKVAVYRFVGEQFAKGVGASVARQPLIALVVGIVMLYLIYMVPVLGFLVWGVVAPLGFGAVVLAAFRAFRSEESRSNPIPATVRPPTYASSSVSIPEAPPNPGPVGVPSSGAMSPVAGGMADPPLIAARTERIPAGDLTLLPRAGFWIRSTATFLDLLLLIVFTVVVQFPPLSLLAWVAYHVGMWTWKGATLGGLVFGLKIIRKDGRPLDFAVALIRSLVSFFSALVFFVGFFWAGWTREKQSWHDLIAGTLVVRIPKGVI